MAGPTQADIAAARRYGRVLDREGISAPYHVSGTALLLKLAKGESGFNSSADSGKAHGRTQFTPASRAESIRKFGIDPWAGVDQAYHAAELHLRGKINGAKGLEGYNPGMASYRDYILGQKVGPVGAGTVARQGMAGGTTTASQAPSTPNLQSGVDLSSLLGQLSQAPAGPQVSAPAAPAHTAAPALPRGYQSPVSSANPAVSAKPSLDSLLQSIQSQGGDVSTPGATTTQAAGPTAAARGAGSGKPIGNVADALSRAATINAKRLPYSLGGGHGGRVDPAKAAPLDCSGAVSAVLGINPRVSSDFERFGSAGRSPSGKGITIYANKTHVLMEINGHFFGTSGANPGGGAGWIPRSQIGKGYLSRFTARHLAAAG